MADFILNTEISTTTPTIDVTVAAVNPLRVGLHRFQLIVQDDSKNDSLPDIVEVRVFDSQRPTAVLSGPAGGAAFGSSFQLSGANSTDLGGGRIVQFRWTYLGPATQPPIVVGPRPPITGPVIDPVAPRPTTPTTPATPVTPVTPIRRPQ